MGVCVEVDKIFVEQTKLLVLVKKFICMLSPVELILIYMYMHSLY